MRLVNVFVVGVLAVKSSSGARSAYKKKPKVGVDIDLNGLFHPWADKSEEDHPTPPTSPHHRIAEYMVSNVHAGDSFDTAIDRFESFSQSHHLGLTLGEEKGVIIEQAISDTFRNRFHGKDVVFLEFGSHIGDGTLRILRQLSKLVSDQNRCTVYSLESNQEWLGIGSSIVRHVMQTTDQSRCKYVPISLSEDVSHLLDVLRSEMEVKTIAGLFLDHNHAKFWRDLSIMDEKGLLTDGTLIIADNALRHKNLMRSFIDEMRRRTTNFRLVDVRDPYPDQLLITEWKQEVRTHHSDEL